MHNKLKYHSLPTEGISTLVCHISQSFKDYLLNSFKLALGFYRKDALALTGKEDPVLPVFIYKANSSAISEHQSYISKIISRIVGDNAALEKAASVTECKCLMSCEEWKKHEAPPVHYE